MTRTFGRKFGPPDHPPCWRDAGLGHGALLLLPCRRRRRRLRLLQLVPLLLASFDKVGDARTTQFDRSGALTE